MSFSLGLSVSSVSVCLSLGLASCGPEDCGQNIIFSSEYTFCAGFPGGSVVKNLPAMQETQEMWVQSLGWEDPLEKEMTTSIPAWEIP